MWSVKPRNCLAKFRTITTDNPIFSTFFTCRNVHHNISRLLRWKFWHQWYLKTYSRDQYSSNQPTLFRSRHNCSQSTLPTISGVGSAASHEAEGTLTDLRQASMSFTGVARQTNNDRTTTTQPQQIASLSRTGLIYRTTSSVTVTCTTMGVALLSNYFTLLPGSPKVVRRGLENIYYERQRVLFCTLGQCRLVRFTWLTQSSDNTIQCSKRPRSLKQFLVHDTWSDSYISVSNPSSV